MGGCGCWHTSPILLRFRICRPAQLICWLRFCSSVLVFAPVYRFFLDGKFIFQLWNNYLGSVFVFHKSWDYFLGSAFVSVSFMMFGTLSFRRNTYCRMYSSTPDSCSYNPRSFFRVNTLRLQIGRQHFQIVILVWNAIFSKIFSAVCN